MINSLLILFSAMGSPCDPKAGSGSFFGLPYWYQYLNGEEDALGKCVPTFNVLRPTDLWGIALAGADILIRIAAMVAVGFIIYAGFQYMTSNGEAERAKNAKNTIINALVGLVIAIVAATVVSFIGNSIK